MSTPRTDALDACFGENDYMGYRQALKELCAKLEEELNTAADALTAYRNECAAQYDMIVSLQGELKSIKERYEGDHNVLG